ATDRDENFFRTELNKRADKIWSSATEELEALSRIEEELKTAESEFRRGAPNRSPLLQWLETAGKYVIMVLIPATVIIAYAVGLDNAIKKVVVMPWSLVSLSVGVVLAIGLIMRISLSISYRMQYQRYS